MVALAATLGSVVDSMRTHLSCALGSVAVAGQRTVSTANSTGLGAVWGGKTTTVVRAFRSVSSAVGGH